MVDHSIVGVSRVSWEMDRAFHDPRPWIFQLQFSPSGLDTSTDWINVGSPVENTLYAEDDQRHTSEYGKRLLTYYRVILTTPLRTYVSTPTDTYGLLDEPDWILAREIIRKENLRHRYVSRSGYLLKRMRFGERCTNCTDPLAGEILNSKCPECNGVGFKVGYHAPIPMIMDLSTDAIAEQRNGASTGPSRVANVMGRTLGSPPLAKEDVWVDARSDQRWFADGAIAHAAEWRGVPLIVSVELSLAPFSHQVYKIEVGGEPGALPGPTLPDAGTGAIRIDHDYLGADRLSYVDAAGDGIVGAVIKAYTEADWEADRNGPEYVKAGSGTMANGRWSHAMNLNPGTYVLVFEKPGFYGPDICTVEVICPDSSSDSSSETPAPFTASAPQPQKKRRRAAPGPLGPQ